jgi:predicted transcriptional regulator
MPAILIRLDGATYKALSRIAPAAKRKRTEFVRRAVKDAIRSHEFARMREAYIALPDDSPDTDDWSNWEEFGA